MKTAMASNRRAPQLGAALVAALTSALLAFAPAAPAHAAARKAAPAAAVKTVKKAHTAAKAAKPAKTKAVKKTGGGIVAHLRSGVSGTPAAIKAHQHRLAARPTVRVSEASALPRAYTPMELSASAAYVFDLGTHEVLLHRNEDAVLPIASITKLMTGLVLAEANLPLGEYITIMPEDVDTLKGSSSRLAVGATLTRLELMHLALMSSENRAAHALGRTYPGGLAYFVHQMNARAMMLGMKDTHYVDPTGLSSANRSSAQDLATLVAEAARYPLLRYLTTSPGYEVAVGERVLQYGNTNRLVHDPDWDITLQKTGYISEAGRCLVMLTRVAGRQLVMVLLDSRSKHSRIADAERVRQWVEEQHPAHAATAAFYPG